MWFQPHRPEGGRIREIMLGFQDGVVSNLGVVLGVSGVFGNSPAILVAGLAAVFAEGVSMFLSQFSASRSLQEYRKRELAVEESHLKVIPWHEKAEVREIYARKGFSGKELERIVEVITANPEVWLATMEKEEMHWIGSEEANPLKDAFFVGGVAIFAGLIPVVPFAFFPIWEAQLASILASALGLFAAGAYRSKVTGEEWEKSGLELLVLGALATLVGLSVGFGLKFLFPGAA